MGKYGHVIKFERIRQKIKQVELAKDICTPAYLSKIESNSIVPSEDIREKLFVRLNINSSSTTRTEEDFLEYVRSIYFEAIMYKDRQKTATLITEVESTCFLFQNASHFYTYQLMMLRLYLIVGEINHPVPEILTSLSEFTKSFNGYQNFIYKVNFGLFCIFKQDYSRAMKYLEEAFDYTERLVCDKWEIADLEYILGLIYIYLNKNLVSMQYSKNAISFFEKKFFYTRVIESYIILAIAYRRSEKYEETVKILQKAKKASIELDITENLHILLFNLGTVLVKQRENELAIENFKECIAISSDPYDKVTCMFAIMNEYAKKNDVLSAIYWCDKGVHICQTENTNRLESMLHHFYCYSVRFSPRSNPFDEPLLKAISYFEKKKDYVHSNKYTIQLAKYYLEKKYYKKSATYYELANEYLAKSENRKHIEDM